MRLQKEEKIAITAATAFMLVFSLLVRISGITLEKIITMQNQIAGVLLGGQHSISFLFVMEILLAMISLSFALSFLSAYGAKNDRYQTGLLAGAASSIVFVALNPAIFSLAVALAIVVAFSYAVPLASTYFAELKKWKLFRTGSNAAGRALMAFNVIVAVGIFVSVSAAGPYYGEVFTKDLAVTISSATLRTVDTDSPVVKEQIKIRVAEMVSKSPLFMSLVGWLPVVAALSAWIALEFLRMLVLPNTSGALTAALLRHRKNHA